MSYMKIEALAKMDVPEKSDDFTKEEKMNFVAIKEAKRLFQSELDGGKRVKEKELKRETKILIR